MQENGMMASLGRNLAILIACAIFCVPALVPLTEPNRFLAVIAALIAYFVISVPKNSSNKSVGGLIFGTSIAILCLRFFFPPDEAKNVWAISLPVALITVRPIFASFAIFISTIVLKIIGWPVYQSLLAILLALLVCLAARHIFLKIWDVLFAPVNDAWSQIRHLFYIFSLCFAVSSFYFAVGHWAIFSNDGLAYSGPEGVNLNSVDFLLYSGIMNASGEPIYISPVSAWARAWSLFQVFYAYAFSAIYFAVAVTRMIEIRNSRS